MGATEHFPRGAAVLVQCSGGHEAQNVVWEDLGDVVMVCGQEQFARLADGYAAPMPIGFNRADVRAAAGASTRIAS